VKINVKKALKKARNAMRDECEKPRPNPSIYNSSSKMHNKNKTNLHCLWPA